MVNYTMKALLNKKLIIYTFLSSGNQVNSLARLDDSTTRRLDTIIKAY